MVVAGNITEEKKHMCEFFSFVTEPNYHGGVFEWEDESGWNIYTSNYFDYWMPLPEIPIGNKKNEI